MLRVSYGKGDPFPSCTWDSEEEHLGSRCSRKDRGCLLPFSALEHFWAALVCVHRWRYQTPGAGLSQETVVLQSFPHAADIGEAQCSTKCLGRAGREEVTGGLGGCSMCSPHPGHRNETCTKHDAVSPLKRLQCLSQLCAWEHPVCKMREPTSARAFGWCLFLSAKGLHQCFPSPPVLLAS